MKACMCTTTPAADSTILGSTSRKGSNFVARYLNEIGRWAFRRRWLVVSTWVVLLGVIGTLGLTSGGSSTEGMSMPGIESQRAADLIADRFPSGVSDGASATVVFVAPDGQTLLTAENQATVVRTLATLQQGGQISSIAAPAGGTSLDSGAVTGFARVDYSVPPAELTDDSRAALTTAVDDARQAGLTVEMSGSVLDTGQSLGMTEVIGVAVAALVLLITLGSIVAAGLPLLTALLGVGISFTAILALAGPLGLSSSTGLLALMLGLAVGIDYALFIVSRYREEVGNGHEPERAAGRAIGTAGSAVVFAGATVVIALASLIVVGIPTLAKMGLASAGAVVVAVVIALTLVPALLGFWPRKVLPRRIRNVHAQDANDDAAVRPTFAIRWLRIVLRRPLLLSIIGVAALGIVALPAASLQLGMPGDESLSTTTTERRAYDELASAFGPGFNGPLTVVVDARDAADPAAAVSNVSNAIGTTDGVMSVSPATFNSVGDTAILRVIPATSPTDEKTKDLVETLRSTRGAIESGNDVRYEVTGTTALNIDIASKVQSALLPYIAVVVGLAVLLLLVVFRSIIVPIKAALGFLLSLLGSLGILVAVFQWGWAANLLGVEQTGPIMSLMPILLVGIVFGLAMDYEVFLVSRIREAHVRGDSADAAIETGFAASSKVVVAAALIMIAVFAGFVGAHDSMIKMIGLGLATAVFFDAFVVRLTLVPAVMHLFGERTWAIPRWLDRALPRIDVEGESLRDDLPDETRSVRV